MLFIFGLSLQNFRNYIFTGVFFTLQIV